MTNTSPLTPQSDLANSEDRLNRLCAMYAVGRIGKVAAAESAGLDLFAFQRALSERGIPQYSDEMLAEDMKSLATLFPV